MGARSLTRRLPSPHPWKAINRKAGGETGQNSRCAWDDVNGEKPEGGGEEKGLQKEKKKPGEPGSFPVKLKS